MLVLRGGPPEKRLHSSLEYTSPTRWEQQYQQAS